MSGSTWTWIGGTINLSSSVDWSLTSGPGNAEGIPQAGDTAINSATLAGFGVIAASMINNGTIEATNNSIPASSTGGNLEIIGAVSGTGSMTIEPGATLQINGALGTGQAIAFSPGAPETLILGLPTETITNPITGFVPGDTIEFSNGVTVTSASLSNGDTLAVTYHNSVGSVGVYDLTDVPIAISTPLLFLTGYNLATNDQDVIPTTFLTWTGTSSTNFATAANWNLGTIVPSVADYVFFDNGVGGTISGTGTVEGLDFYNSGTWFLASGTSLTAVGPNLNIGASGGGTRAAGALTIGGGSTMITGGMINVGVDPGNVATLTVSGGGVLDDSAPADPTGGAAGQGAMEVGARSASGSLAAASGSVVVTGTGSVIDLGLNGLWIASGGGNGSMTVSLGGSLISTTANSALSTSISVGSQGDGVLTVTDPGSEVTADGIVNVGHSGTGTLTVENYATFLAALDPLGGGGLNIGSGLSNGAGIGGTGYATVTTDGVLDSLGNLGIGIRGDTGALDVLNGGTVEVGTTLSVGSGGTLGNRVSETGTATLAIGANGTVELTGGAQTSSYGAILGNSNNSEISVLTTGVATVSGTGALLNLDGNGIAVGQYGDATLTVAQGGSVASGTANSNLISALAIGRQGSGTVTVTDAGSELTADGFVYVSRAGSGSLIVENQGSVVIGLDGTGGGGLGVGGAGFTSGSILYVGGTGSALVTLGGSLSTQSGITVGENGATGTMTVTGGTVTASGQLLIGASTVVATGGTLVSATGTTVVATSTEEIGTGFVTVGAGGVLDVGQNGSNAVAIVVGDTVGSTGALNVTSGGSVIADGGLSVFQNSMVSIAAGGNVSVTGSLTLAASGTLTNAGTLTYGGTLTDSGTFNNESTLSSGGTITGPGTLSNAAGAVISGALIAEAAGETISNLGTIAGAVSLNGGDLLVTGAGAVFSGGITGGTGGNTLEIATGPYALENFDAAGTPQYTTLQIDNGVSVGIDSSDTLTGVTLLNDGILDLTAFEPTAAVQNSGSITGDVTLTSGVPLTNTAGGTISGSGLAVIEALGPASVMNSGVIDPATYGVDLTMGGSVTNAAGGTIEGTIAGVLISGGAGTVTNGGLISGGGTDAVTLAAGFANRVILDPGAAFTGLVDGGNTIGASLVSTLELAATSATGTLTGFGTEFVNFAQLVVDPGAAWNLGGGNVLAANATLTNQGTMVLSGTTVTGGGAVTIDSTAGLPAAAVVTGGGSWSGNSNFLIGAAGAGDLLVNTAGTVSASGVDEAQSAGSAGDITVTGTNSLLNDIGSFIVGDGGLGSLAIDAGGTVTTTAGATIGNTGSAGGSSVNVSGAGSNWQIGGELVVGAAGFGQLAVSQAGSVGAASVDLGSAASGSAGLLVSGADSILNVAGLVTIGDQSGATVSLQQDGSLFANDLNVGTGNGLGELIVDGTPVGGFQFDQSGDVLNPALSVANDMTVGANGVFILGANEVVHIANNFVIAGPVIQGAGSQIDPSTVTNTVKTGGGSGASQTGSTKIVNNSTYYAGEDKNGTFILNTPSLTGTGVLEVGQLTLNTAGAPGNLVLNAGVVDATQTVNFVGGPGTLTLGTNAAVDAIAGFHATIDSFNSNDTIVVDTAAAATFVPVGSVVTVSTGGSLTFASAALALTATTTQGALVDQVVPCYAAGTLIETVDGPVAVEDLRPGDEVRTLLGGPGRIVWVGSRAVDCARHRRPETVWPVRIERGAFAENVPARDLFVSPDHAIYVDGVLIPAKLLINGTSITQVKRSKVTYYHVELARHDVVLAEGLPAETYLDTGDRENFVAETTVRLFPDFAARLATAMVWEARGAAPLVQSGDALETARRMVAEIAVRPRMMPPLGNVLADA